MGVGVAALEQGMYGRASEWFTAARDVTHHHKTGTEQDQALREKKQRQIHHLHILLNLTLAATAQEALEEEVTEVEKSDSLPATTKDHHATTRLCRGHTISDAGSRLRCRVDARGSSWLTLMPVKMEEHSLDPLILSFHDVLSPHQLAVLRHLATPMLQEAVIQGMETEVTHNYRSSYTSWLHHHIHPVVAAANRMIAALTGLEVDESKDEAERLQINLYAAGGHYVPHMDFMALYRTLWEADEPDQKVMKQFPSGDRIATFMFYMSDVEEGGWTVFPRLGVGVKPRQGSAVFWYNLLPSGKGDPRTLHSACPVLRGSKWVSNKWIKYYPQLHHKPCLPLVK